MWRQGDVLIQAIDEFPAAANRPVRPVLASGDSTGHKHRIADPRSAQLFVSPRDGELFLNVVQDEARLVHPEHDSIVLPRGRYRVWRQREYDELGDRRIAD
jgi:hypothetical protein